VSTPSCTTNRMHTYITLSSASLSGARGNAVRAGASSVVPKRGRWKGWLYACLERKSTGDGLVRPFLTYDDVFHIVFSAPFMYEENIVQYVTDRTQAFVRDRAESAFSVMLLMLHAACINPNQAPNYVLAWYCRATLGQKPYSVGLFVGSPS
jgi:hypothetical protein